jgi:predicted DNA-binding transcriptional regulator YafY
LRCHLSKSFIVWKILLAYYSASAALIAPIRPYADTVVIFGCGFAALCLGVFACYSLVCIENQWYLRAWDLVRRDLRTFHLGRITQAKKLLHHFKRPAGFDVNESFLDSIGVYIGTDPENVVLRFSGWAATVINERVWHPSQTIRKREDETVELRLKVAINPELERWLWSWGDAVEVVSPLTLRDSVRASHQRAAVRNR